jgi:hypothetical protein
VAADISPRVTPAADGGAVPVPVRTHRVRGWVLLGFAVWNVVVWGNRAVNMVGDRTEWSVGFVVVHLVLFGMGLAAAVVLGTIGWRMRREASGAPAPPRRA